MSAVCMDEGVAGQAWDPACSLIRAGPDGGQGDHDEVLAVEERQPLQPELRHIAREL